MYTHLYTYIQPRLNVNIKEYVFRVCVRVGEQKRNKREQQYEYLIVIGFPFSDQIIILSAPKFHYLFLQC